MSGMSRRGTLSRDAVITAAAAVADRAGIDGVTMRSVGAELGVEGMSLYHHVANKDDLLDALAGWVFEQIELPPADSPWRPAMEARAGSAREILRRHPWAVGMFESRPTPSTALLRHHDRVLGWLFAAGFTAALATHAFAAVDSFVYGFVLHESSLPFQPGDGAEAAYAESVADQIVGYPHLQRSITELLAGGYDFATEFEVGLELILDSVAVRAAATP